MSSKRLLRAWPGLVLLCSATLSPQMPPQPARLVIDSDPSGAALTINGVSRGERTNATLNVSPGSYKVSVGASGGTPHCAGTLAIKVNSGQTATWLCTGTSWAKEGSIQ
ncbi:MAG: PEGA domain-containing protein [Acidobacteriaceae bacterium]|jgi:hypothetical protein